MNTWWIPIDIGIIQGLILASAVLGFSIALRVLRFPDLTVEGSILLGGAAYAASRSAGGGFVPATLIAVGVGAAAGAATATLHVRLSMNKFLAGILVIAAAYSVSLRIMKGSNIGLLDVSGPFERTEALNRLGPPNTHLGDAALLGLLVFAAASVSALILRSPTGMRLRAAGCNPSHARALGIPVGLSLIVGLAVTNALAALSGVLLATYQGFADIGMGYGTLIVGLASLAIGERLVSTSRLPGYLTVILAACLGSILYQCVMAIAIRLGLAPTDLKLATAVIVLLIVAVRITKTDDLLLEAA